LIEKKRAEKNKKISARTFCFLKNLS